MSKVERILLATDGSTNSAGAVDRALELAQHVNAALYVVHVAHLSSKRTRDNSAAEIEEQKEREFLELHAVTAQIAHRAQTIGIRCVTRTAFTENVVDAVIAAAIDWACDLIIVGASPAHCSPMSAQTGRQITTRSQTPVMIVP